MRTLRETRQPVILTVNDLYALTKGSGGAFRRIAQTIKFQRLPVATIREVLTEIAAAENIEIEPAVVQRLAANASGDLRGALNDLQSLAEGELTVNDEQVDALGVRDRESEMFDTLRAIFEGDDYDGPRKAIFDLHEPPGEVATWVSDNLPLVYRQPNDLERAYRRVAHADLLLARTRRQQNYGLWGYASELLSSGVALSRRHPPSGARLQFPSWIRKMGASRGTRAARDSLAAKIGAAAHMSKRQAKLEQLAVVAASCRGDADKAARIAGKLELTEGELAQLLSTTPKDRKLKAIMEAAQPFRQEREVITLKTRPTAAKRAAAASDEAVEPAKPDVAADRKQKSLFDF
jgi:replication factor C large subunit